MRSFGSLALAQDDGEGKEPSQDDGKPLALAQDDGKPLALAQDDGKPKMLVWTTGSKHSSPRAAPAAVVPTSPDLG